MTYKVWLVIEQEDDEGENKDLDHTLHDLGPFDTEAEAQKRIDAMVQYVDLWERGL